MRPEVRIRLTTDFFGNKGFDPDEFDIGFSVENVSGRAQNIVATPIFPKVMSPACAPQLLHPMGPLRTPSDLSALKLLHESRDREDWKYWVNHFHVANIDPNSGDVFPNLDMATKAAVMGSGMVMADLMLCRDELESSALVLPFKNLKCETPHGQYCFIVSAERVHGPNLKKFITWLDEIKVRNTGYCTSSKTDDCSEADTRPFALNVCKVPHNGPSPQTPSLSVSTSAHCHRHDDPEFYRMGQGS